MMQNDLGDEDPVSSSIGEQRTSRFTKQFSGSFSGLMQWRQWDLLVSWLRRNNEGWFVYYIGEAVPAVPLAWHEFDRFITEIDALLRRDHREDYLGIVYVDSPIQPIFIKIYDPNNLGAACGSSGGRVLPGWTVSRAAPVDLLATVSNPGGRRRWWQNLFT